MKNNRQEKQVSEFSQSIIIIGAGIGGLATSIQLALKGFKVTIYEKEHRSGGRCQKIEKKGFVFDSGPTMYIFPQLYKSFFESIGENVSDYFNLLPANPTYRLDFGDRNLVLTDDEALMKKQLEKIEPGSYQRYREYLRSIKKLHDFAIKNVVQAPLEHVWNYLNPTNLFTLIKLGGLMPHYRFVSRYFKHPYLRAAFTFQDSYLGLHPFVAPALFGMFAYSEARDGNFLPQGGMYRVIEALEQIAIKKGVRIEYGKAVRKISFADGKAEGVILENGKRIYADYVIANADLSYVYDDLIGRNQTRKLGEKRHSCSALTFHWGLKQKYPQLMTHNLFFSRDYKSGFDEVLDGNHLPNEPHFYVQVPTKIDTSRAPLGCEVMSVIVPINNKQTGAYEWDKYSLTVRKYIIKRLEQAGLEKVENNIVIEVVTSPDDWQKRFNLTHGAIYGLDHGIINLGYFRQKRQHTKFKNLYFVGASNHPGSGLPTVLQSAKFTSQKIINHSGA